jgi:hypothetical protein
MLPGKMRNAFKILVTNPEGKKPFRKPRLRWKDYIKTDLRKIGLEGVDWIYLAEDRESCLF